MLGSAVGLTGGGPERTFPHLNASSREPTPTRRSPLRLWDPLFYHRLYVFVAGDPGPANPPGMPPVRLQAENGRRSEVQWAGSIGSRSGSTVDERLIVEVDRRELVLL